MTPWPPDERYDTIICTCRLIEVPDLLRAATGMARLLADGGDLHLVEPVNRPGSVGLLTSSAGGLAARPVRPAPGPGRAGGGAGHRPHRGRPAALHHPHAGLAAPPLHRGPGPPVTVGPGWARTTGMLALVGGGEWSPGCTFDQVLIEASGATEVAVLPTGSAYENPAR